MVTSFTVFRVALVIAFSSALWGCAAPCPAQPLSGVDGGTAACVQATDCPRSSSVLLCTSDRDRLFGCIACEQNQCVQYAAAGSCP